MSAPADDLRSLKTLVAIFAVVIVVLGVAWLMRSTPPTELTAPTSTRTMSPDAEGMSSGVTNTDPASAPRTNVTDVPTSSAEDAAIPLDTRCIIYGTLRSADGALVRSGYISFYTAGTGVRTATLWDGKFTLTGLRPGEHQVVAVVLDELPLNQIVTLSAPVTRLDLRLVPKWNLTVHAVTPDGKALRGTVGGRNLPGLGSKLTAYASYEPLTEDLPLPTGPGVTEQVGRFRIDRGGGKVLPESAIGLLTLPTDRPIHVALLLGSARIAEQRVPPGQSEVTFTVAPSDVSAKTGTLRLRLVDGSGTPVSEGHVMLPEASSGGGRPVDADGRITIGALSPGRFVLSILTPGYVAPPLMVEIHPGADLDIGNVRVERPVVVGIEVPGVTGDTYLTLASLDRAPNDLVLPGRQRIGVHAGKNVDLLVFPGRYVLHASNRNAGIAMLELDTRALPPMPIRLVPSPGAPLTFDVEVAGTRIELVQGVAAILLEREFNVAMEGVTLDVHPGDYTIRIQPPTGPLTERKLSVPPAGGRLRIP